MRKTQSERVSNKFPVLDRSKCSILIYSDTSYGNLPDDSSQGGCMILLCDEMGRCVPTTWSSTESKRIVKSTLAVACMTLYDAADTCIFISSLFSELNIMYCKSEPLKIVCKIDSKGLCRRLRQMMEIEEL